MDREDAAAVVQAGHRIDIGAIEEMPPQRRGACVGHDAGRQHKPDAAARPRELQRALDEQLIAVDVRPAFDAVDARFTSEVGELARLEPAAGADVGIAAVAADHVPRRIAENRVEACVRPRFAVLVQEDFGERERPVKKPVARRQRGRVLEKPVRRRATAASRGRADRRSQQFPEQRAVGRRPSLPEPAGAPQIEHRRPAAKRRMRRMKRRERLLLRMNDGRGVVRIARELQARADGLLQTGVTVMSPNSGSGSGRRCCPMAAGRLPPDIVEASRRSGCCQPRDDDPET